MASKPALSVVIPAYNAEKTLEKLLKSLTAQTFQDYEVIVVDDGSTDNTPHVARELGAKVFRLTHTGCIGLLRNIGATKASADVIVTTDADCIPQQNWLEEVDRSMRTHQCIVGAVVHRPLNILALPFQTEVRDWSQRRRRHELQRTWTGNLAIRTSVFKEVHGFNPHLRRSEDRELGLTLVKKGIKITRAPKALIYHHHSVTLKSHFLKMFFTGRCHIHINRIYEEFTVQKMKHVAVAMRSAISVLYRIPDKVQSLGSLIRLVSSIGYVCGLLVGSMLDSNEAQSYRN